MCDLTHSCVWHDSFICVTWLICTCDMTHSYVWYDSFICVTGLIHTCDMTHSYVWHNSFICVTWLAHMCDMTSPYVCHYLFIRMTWLILICDMTHFDIWHDSFSFVARSEKRRICCPWLILILMLRMTHFHSWQDSSRCTAINTISKLRQVKTHSWHHSSSFVTWLILIRDMTHHDVLLSIPYPNSISQNSFVTWLIVIRDMTAPHDSFSFVTFVTFATGSVIIWYIVNTLNSSKRCRGRGANPPLRFTSRMRMSHVTNENESCHEWVFTIYQITTVLSFEKLYQELDKVVVVHLQKKKCTRTV